MKEYEDFSSEDRKKVLALFDVICFSMNYFIQDTD